MLAAVKNTNDPKIIQLDITSPVKIKLSWYIGYQTPKYKRGKFTDFKVARQFSQSHTGFRSPHKKDSGRKSNLYTEGNETVSYPLSILWIS